MLVRSLLCYSTLSKPEVQHKLTCQDPIKIRETFGHGNSNLGRLTAMISAADTTFHSPRTATRCFLQHIPCGYCQRTAATASSHEPRRPRTLKDRRARIYCGLDSPRLLPAPPSQRHLADADQRSASLHRCSLTQNLILRRASEPAIDAGRLRLGQIGRFHGAVVPDVLALVLSCTFVTFPALPPS